MLLLAVKKGEETTDILTRLITLALQTIKQQVNYKELHHVNIR